MQKDVRRGNDVLLRRLALAWLVGGVATAAAITVIPAALFGGWAITLGGLTVVVVVSSAALARVHRATSGGQLGSSSRWGIGVSLTSLTLAGLTAAGWQSSGGSFGRSPLVWVAAGGIAFVLCAAVASRLTAVPAGLLVVGLVVFAVANLVPDGAFTHPARGCIAQSAEEADRNCP